MLRGANLRLTRIGVYTLPIFCHSLQKLGPEGTVQSCCVVLGAITQRNYDFIALREDYRPFLLVLPFRVVSYLYLLLVLPAGFSLLVRSSRTSLVLSLRSFRGALAAAERANLYLYNGECKSGLSSCIVH